MQQKPRRGFDSSDFQDDQTSTSLQLSSPHSSSSSTTDTSIFNSASCNIKQSIYHFIDSYYATIFIIFLSFFDFILLIISNYYFLNQTTSSHLNQCYKLIDYLTAICYFIEVHLRVYTYGIMFYFHSIARTIEYFISIINTVFILTFTLTHLNWLLITRTIRLIKSFTSITNWRETQLKWRTRQELQKLIESLDDQTNERNKLTNWKIDSKQIVLGEKAGEGGFGAVFSGLFRGTLVAVKQISSLHDDNENRNNQNQQSTLIEDEAITLVNLRHPNVVLFMGFVHEPRKIWIVTEYCSRGSLRELLDDKSIELSQSRMLKLALGAARGLAYLHGQQPPVLHLDLKTSNILISSGWDSKLADFGLSRSIDRIEKEWFSGTMQYAAPEILESNVFSTAADIYSFGVCLWELATRDIPFQGMPPHAILWGVVKSNLRPPLDIFQYCDDSKPNTPLKSPVSLNDNNYIQSQNSIASASEIEEAELVAVRRETQQPQNFTENAFQSLSVDTLKNYTSVAEQNHSPRDSQSHNADLFSNSPRKTVAHFQALFEGKRKVNRFSYNREESITRSSCDGNFEIRHARNLPPPIAGLGPRVYEKHNDPVSDNPLKKRSDGIVQPRQGKVEKESDIANLTHRVTAAIQLFDDRPPIARLREVDESDLENMPRTPRSVGTVPASPFPNRVRSSLLTVPTREPKQSNQKTGGTVSFNSNSSTSISNLERSNTEPFLRRLASFTRNGTGDKKNSFYSKSAVNSIQDIITTTKEEVVKFEKKKLLLSVPKDYVDLVERCWAMSPTNRPSAGEIVWRLVLLIDGHKEER